MTRYRPENLNSQKTAHISPSEVSYGVSIVETIDWTVSVFLQGLNNVAVMEARKHMDAFREQYDILVAEDKVMDKAFKREFHDVPAHFVDILHKLFRRRPR